MVALAFVLTVTLVEAIALVVIGARVNAVLAGITVTKADAMSLGVFVLKQVIFTELSGNAVRDAVPVAVAWSAATVKSGIAPMLSEWQYEIDPVNALSVKLPPGFTVCELCVSEKADVGAGLTWLVTVITPDEALFPAVLVQVILA